MRFWNRTLRTVLILSVVVAISTIIYLAVNPNKREGFTEFYILNVEGKAEGYPDELSIGEKGNVLLGIVNREGELTKYRVDIMLNGEIDWITLEREEVREQIVSFIPSAIGEGQNVEFILYKDMGIEPYINLLLYIDVI